MKKQKADQQRMEQQRKHVTMMNKSREAQRYMIKISTYQEFEMKMLDTKKRTYKTHVLLMFVGNKQAEKKGHEELYFPHPFTTTDITNNNILQVARIRYNTDTA